MFTSSHHRRRGTRRGVVLILVLGMLGLMALIGVMFASYSGQAEINARNYALAQNAPDPANVLDFALAQLINDTDNPMSALRGHGLLRDMYGNDASNNGYLAGGKLTGATQMTTGPYAGLFQCATDIPVSASNGYDFTRWILRFPPNQSGASYFVAQTFEVIADDVSGTTHVLYVTPPDPTPSPAVAGYWSSGTPPTTQSALIGLQTNVAFELDGRYLRAFNGPGMGDFGRFGNFRVNGDPLLGNDSALTTGNPNAFGMDEDYDACDLENWFLAIQSADGQVVIPSFHRPGILTAADWTNTVPSSRSKILRPRGGTVDGHSPVSFPSLIPDATGKITYDVDNDGDGVMDAVWLDLGYPASRNAAGQLQKPLFAFTVIGLNGRLPLNTAGNLQLRRNVVGASGEPVGSPLFLHAAHLGTSPSEIDPTYALQNAPDLNLTDYTQVDDAGVDVRYTQLRNLLTGTRPQDKPYILGVNNGDSNFVRVNGQNLYLPNNMADGQDVGTARLTAPVAGRWGEEEAVPQTLAAAPDFNSSIRAGLSQGYGDARDDNFNTFDPWPSPSAGESPAPPSLADYYDAAGGLSLPSERIRRFLSPIDVAGTGQITTWDTVSNAGADALGRVSFLNYFRPPGVPFATATYPTGTTFGDPVIPNQTNNPYHGYEAYRHPKVANLTSILAAGMPSNFGPGTSVPTYDQNINSTAPFSVGLNEADEMRLYAPNGHDAPFGPRDLEWLYRRQDIDGASLDSRLAKLAPVSFLNPSDGIRRRRMFSTDSWETTNFVWANDNPQGAFPNNSRFASLANASFANLKVPAGAPAASPFNNALFNNLAPASPANGAPANDPVVGPPARTPALAHRDRKINLNYPLPVSNDPNEPIRQKWIRDTYQMFKAILPPLAVDTPEELAQLSQFVVNIIDFRDPDGTMTRFENRDLVIKHPTSTPDPDPMLPPTLASAEISYASAGAPAPPASDYLVQYGMEYNPVAINEILAYQFDRKAGDPPVATPTKRLLIELVNTLTEAAGIATPNPSALNLDGWDLVVMEDNSLGRPDPITGQIPVQATPTSVSRVPLEGTPAAPLPRATPLLPLPADSTVVPPANYYVLENPLAAQADPVDPAETKTFTPVAPPLDDEITSKLEAGKYYWLYLRRPPNPFDPTYDAAQPNANRVVVDSFRFFFNKSTGTGVTVPPDVVTAPGSEFLYSLQRLQPYRGGHAVSTPPVGPPPAIRAPAAYGYSEQAVPALGAASGTGGMFGMYGKEKVTLEIKNTLGSPNDPKDAAWDYVPINDRDFTSVAELLMVPGCSPGLFTKAFAEAAPPIAVAAARTTPPAVSDDPATTFVPEAPRFADPDTTVSPRNVAQPHSSPYLVENFFYHTKNVTDAGGVVGGPGSAGWFKIMEFVEVPSPAADAIGTVAQGHNYDWYRQDVKPGLLNLNLIIDEEVFLGLMADARLNMAQLTNAAPPGQLVPKVVTMIDGTTGLPTFSYAMNNLGFFAADPVSGMPSARLKASFSDFLKLRHGGSGFLFGFGLGDVGTTNARERPFHSLSYPDINFTVMRPATLPPPAGSLVVDPGVKSPALAALTNPQPPPIPPRRLFQIPDAYPGYASDTPPDRPSNASETGDPQVHSPTTNANLANTNASLATPVPANYLGGSGTGSEPLDRRQHPYFRTEWLQKVTNLTTVRTHQYAVWITVGFFEVRRQGNPQMAATEPDQLGLEIGAMAGRNVRYRSFFILDRTRAHGFNPSAPGDFRDVVTYRQRIQ